MHTREHKFYRLQVMNATETMQQYRIGVSGLTGLALVSDGLVAVDATETRWVAVTLQLPYDAATPGSHEIHFDVEAVNSAGRVSEKSVFLVPR